MTQDQMDVEEKQKNPEMKASIEKKGFYYEFFQRQYPTWLYTVAIALFALGCYIWIEFFLVVQY